MAAIKNCFRFDPAMFSYGTQSTLVINGTNDAVGTVWRAPKTGSIRYIGAALYSAPTLSPTFDMRLEGVTTDANTPDGNLVSSPDGHATWSPTAAGFVWVQLAADVAVTAGNYYAAVVRGLGADTSNFATVLITWNFLQCEHPLGVFQADGGAWSIGSYRPVVAVKYTDGTVPLGMQPHGVYGYTDFSPSTSPDEIAVLFSAGAAFDVIGALVQMSFEGATSEADVILYNGATQERVASFQGDRAAGNGIRRMLFAEFPSYYRLTVGNSYRLAVKPTTGSHRVTTVDFVDADARNACFGDGQFSERVDAGTWSETSTKVPLIVPIFNEITLPAGGGGLLVHPGMAGGMRG